MQINTQSFLELIIYVNTLWSAPLQIIISLALIWNQLQESSLSGLLVMLIFIPVNVFLANKAKNYRTQKLKQQDTRIKLINEVLNGIKVLKLYGWENSFNNIINKVREIELKILAKFNIVSTLMTLGNI